MSVARIYQHTVLKVHESMRLDDTASHHLARVLRAAVGDEITLFNGQGGEYLARIKHIDKKGVVVEVVDFKARDVESHLNLLLAQGIARGEKMDFIVQKAVELGANHITPLITERCNVRLSHDREAKRLAHWRAIAVSACEQSGRNTIPHIAAPMTLPDWLPAVHADLKFVLSPHVQEQLPTDLPLPTSPISIAVLIGPEGGLSNTEMSDAIQHGFLPLNLGPRILRTETATLAILSVLQTRFGDFG